MILFFHKYIGEKCGCKLLERFEITQPTLSHHMKILVECGLVNDRKEGKWHHYSLNCETLNNFKYFIDGLTCVLAKPKVAFICVHNSCRSQIAEALGKHLASDIFESYSAGTETRPQINQDAVRIMKELYGIDMESEGQYSKLIDEIPMTDIAISMGCNVGCPFIGRPFDDNWGLEDPTGKSDEEFKKVIDEIRMQVLALKQRLSRTAEK